jgi:hypothetical protein
VERHGGDFVAAVQRRAIQRLDIRQHLIDNDAVRIDGAARQAKEHERVVRVGTVGYGDFVFRHG